VNEPLLSVIVLNWNGKRFNQRCLASLVTQIGDDELIFLDNGSSDGSLEVAREQFAQSTIRWIKNDRNLGFAGGMNVGAAAARGRFLLLLNNDTEFAEGALVKLRRRLETDDSFIAGQCALLRPEDGRLQGVGVSVDLFGLCYVLGAGDDPRAHQVSRRVHSGIGAALVIDRQFFASIGGFDESYFLFYEETDLCWRTWLAGGNVQTIPDVHVYHVGSGTAGVGPEMLRLFIRNRVRTLRKNLGGLLRVIAVSGNLLAMLGLASFLACRRQVKHATAVLSGLRDGIFDGYPASKRRLDFPHRVSNAQLLRQGILLFPNPNAVRNLRRFRPV